MDSILVFRFSIYKANTNTFCRIKNIANEYVYKLDSSDTFVSYDVHILG